MSVKHDADAGGLAFSEEFLMYVLLLRKGKE
jgi:hypothetical protein